MKRKDVTIENKLGFHARPASMFVRKALSFNSEITVEKNGEKASGKSIMALMALAAAKGTVLTLIADGEDADTALNELGQLFADKFGEDE